MICHIKEAHSKYKETNGLKIKEVKGQKMKSQNINQKKSVVAVLMSDKKDYRGEDIIMDKSHIIIIKESTPQDFIITLHIYTLNKNFKAYQAKNCQDGREEQIYHNYFGDFYTPHSISDGTSRQKICKPVQDLTPSII